MTSFNEFEPVSYVDAGKAKRALDRRLPNTEIEFDGVRYFYIVDYFELFDLLDTPYSTEEYVDAMCKLVRRQ